MKRWMIVIVVLTLILPSSAVWAQAPEGQEYIVKAGDELNKIAAEYLGDPKAYHEIVDATNLKTEEDISYAPIGNPDVIEVGQKLWIPVSAGTTTEPLTEPIASPTTEAKPAATVTETEVIYYVPEVPQTTQEGSCWTSSVSTPAGWRCMVGNSIYDPCLIATDGKTVVCGIDTPDEAEFALKLTEPLPAPDAPADMQEVPYKIELADGTTCGFMTGATTGYDDKRLNWGCDDADSSGIFGDLREGTVWTGERTVGEMTDDGFKPTRTQIVPLSKVWFMGPEPTPEPTKAPTAVPTAIPTKAPAVAPTTAPATVAPTRVPTVAPTEVPAKVSKTEVVHYVPDVPKTTLEGSCWTGSFSTPLGYRCTVGNSIYDPCLIATDGKTVVCGFDAPNEQSFALKLTEALPDLDIPEGAEEMPFQLDLANGAACNFATGTLIPVGDNIVQYYCSDEYGILDNIQQGTVWKATEVLTGDMDANGKVEVKDSRAMDIAKVWYGPEMAAAQAAVPTVVAKSKTAPAATAPSAALALAYAGEYSGKPAAGGELTLRLQDDGTLELTTTTAGVKPPVVEVGTWASGPNATIVATLTGTQDGSAYEQPETLSFKLVGTELTAVDFDKAKWGTTGLTLEKQ